jgi:tetratricopeptide (TPR) repeat protein
MNIGKAQLENRSSTDAIAAFEKAVEIRPESPPALRNLARAFLLARDSDGVRRALDRAARAEADSAATAYLLGIHHARQTQFAEAMAPFETAARLDPHTATLRFQLAVAYQAIQRHDDAQQQLRETLRLDPLHASAHFKLSTYARQRGDMETAQAHMREFMRLRQVFGDESRNTEALESCVYTRPEPATPAIGTDVGRQADLLVRFHDATDILLPDESSRTADCLTVLDVDAGGNITLFAAHGASGYRLLQTSADAWRPSAMVPLADNAEVLQCVAGDFFNAVPPSEKYDAAVHARGDVIVMTSSGPRLLQRTSDGAFSDVTKRSGIAGGRAEHATWVDFEHDGDLDLLLSAASGPALWQNNGDGSFRMVTDSVGVVGADSAVASLAVELHEDVAVDLIVARSPKDTVVFENLRTGQFRLRPDPPGPLPAGRAIIADDFDNDGHADIVVGHEHGAVVIHGAGARRSTITDAELAVHAIAALDVDNDGWLELALGGVHTSDPARGMVSLHRWDGSGWRPVHETVGLRAPAIPPVTEIHAFDADSDGDTDLTEVTSDGLRVLRNEGGNKNRQLKLRLTTVKTNPSGLGTRVEVRAGAFRLTRFVHRLPIEIGVGSRNRLDAVQTLWTNGVVDNQINVEVPTDPLTLVEKNVATGSCPFLFAWDGQRFRFVTDLLGNSPIGLPLSREVMLPADPEEIVWIGSADGFPAREGSFVLTVTNEFREVFYLDEARLIAIDHPIGTETHSTDKIMFPPFPGSEVRVLGSPRSLRQSHSDDGIDRTEALRRLDGEFAAAGKPLPPPYRGMCRPLGIILDFGPLDHLSSPVLAMTGWLQYGDGSTNIALSQDKSLKIILPMLEAETTDGSFMAVDTVVGMPAGKTKTILVDIAGKLPPGARRLRLTTSFEIRWDRIALFEVMRPQEAYPYASAPKHAELSWRGFSEIRSPRPGHPTTPDFGSVSPFPAWRRALQGWCTRYGDVRELLEKRDDRMVIMNAGDALELTFDAGVFPPAAERMVRSFFFYSVGWDKDGDHNVVDGDTVAPLPRSLSASTDSTAVPSDSPTGPIEQTDGVPTGHDWELEYNTRWVPGNRFENAPGGPPPSAE